MAIATLGICFDQLQSLKGHKNESDFKPDSDVEITVLKLFNVSPEQLSRVELRLQSWIPYGVLNLLAIRVIIALAFIPP